MRDLINIEKSAFRRGEYVGYGNGTWRIRRCGKPGTMTYWRAWRRDDGKERYAPTLANMSEILRNISEKCA